MNLLDRAKNVEDLRQNAENEKPKNDNLQNITQKSSPQSQEQMLLSKLQKVTEQLQTALSDKRNLESTMQKQLKKIASQADQIAKLNGADLILKENEMLREENENLICQMEETEHWASNQVSACKADYEEKESLLTEKEFKLEGKIRRADDLIEHREEYIESEADKRAAKITKKVKDEYREKTEKYKNDYEIKRQSLYGAFILSICYGVLTTIFRCFQSDRFMYDFGASLLWIWEYISGRFMAIYDAAEGVWLFFASIPYPVIGAICGGLLVIIVVIILLLIFYVVPIGGIGLLTYLYVSRIGDLLSASVALGSFATIVWFADNMTAITLNLILVWFLVQGVYVVTRSICVYFRMYH